MNSVATVNRGVKPIDQVRAALNLPSMRQQLQMALPAHVSIDKFLRVAVTALQQRPALLTADRNSLFASIVTAAQLGLLPDEQLGEAYFVPFKGKVQLIAGYRGLIKLARQGDIGHVEAELIYSNDDVLYELGDESRFTVKVNWQDRGNIVAAYAVAKFRDGGLCARVVMMKHEIDAIRAKSQAANGPAWSDSYSEMARKTVLRRLSKYLPLTTEAQRGFKVSELAEEQNRAVTVDEDGQIIAEADEQIESSPAPRKRRRSALDGLLESPVDTPEREPGHDDGDPADLLRGDDDGEAPHTS